MENDFKGEKQREEKKKEKQKKKKKWITSPPSEQLAPVTNRAQARWQGEGATMKMMNQLGLAQRKETSRLPIGISHAEHSKKDGWNATEKKVKCLPKWEINKSMSPLQRLFKKT